MGDFMEEPDMDMDDDDGLVAAAQSHSIFFWKVSMPLELKTYPILFAPEKKVSWLNLNFSQTTSHLIVFQK